MSLVVCFRKETFIFPVVSPCISNGFPLQSQDGSQLIIMNCQKCSQGLPLMPDAVAAVAVLLKHNKQTKALVCDW